MGSTAGRAARPARSGRLNPFFIRAWVQPLKYYEKIAEKLSLNPFFIRAWVQPHIDAHFRYCPGLNPFFIRAWVQPPMPCRAPPCPASLNPFFIRAWVQPDGIDQYLHGRQVLIPSSSGHGFNPKRSLKSFSAAIVLIPSSSGHGFNQNP